MIKVLKEGREVGGDNVKKISSDILEMKREMERKKRKQRTKRRGDKNSALKQEVL